MSLTTDFQATVGWLAQLNRTQVALAFLLHQHGDHHGSRDETETRKPRRGLVKTMT